MLVVRTLVSDLEDWPQNLLSLLPFMRSILGIFHLIAKFKQSVLDIVEAIWWRLSISRRSYWRHGDGLLG